MAVGGVNVAAIILSTLGFDIFRQMQQASVGRSPFVRQTFEHSAQYH